jgi:hypothetical protein
MEKQIDHPEIGKVVFDNTLNQFAILLEVYRERPDCVWLYVLEYVDNKKRERFLSEIELRPVRHCFVVG